MSGCGKTRLKDKVVLFVLTTLRLGGAERQALLLARYLKRHTGALPIVLGLYSTEGRVKNLCDEAGIPCESLPFGFPGTVWMRLRALFYFARVLRRYKPAILLPYTAHPNIFCGLTWRLTQARDCIWNQRDEGRLRIEGWPEAGAVRLTRRFVSNSKIGAEFLEKSLGVSADRIEHVSNGVELAAPVDSVEAWRERLGAGARSFVATMVANIHPYKDHATLLRAWNVVCERLKPKGIDPILALAGVIEGSQRHLFELCTELELDRQVRFLGPVNDIAGLLSASQIGVFSSVSEGSPNGVLECMAAGLPVAGTDIDGIREAVGNGGRAYLAPPRDAAALARIILDLAADPGLCGAIGDEMRVRIETEFSPRTMCERMIGIISR